ncbi:PI-PLC X domain-containing protein 1 [Podospora australis]|uniref:PI-PLC X domain-containing protein 1 n=1 Tax=Podospora australis TaxID=1536484 RepID=A0AAN6WZS1_9PEZI|nr:PI-PLC X domain-containing protein 1 [Podospora australis]
MASFKCIGLLLLTSIAAVHSQSVSEATEDAITLLTGTKSGPSVLGTGGTPTGSYQTYSSRITLATTSLPTTLGELTANYTETPSTVTYLTGSITSATTTTSGNATSTSTTAAPPRPTNTRPCNNYPELCERKYGNITQVGCHNSPFVRQGSAAANQQFNVTDQLNDGVRFLQAQIQFPVNGTQPHFCHTSCDLFDAGPITDWLTKVKDWVASHPYDVVTILLGNGNYSNPDLYVPWIEKTGLLQYVYTPHVIPMRLDDWPTLAQMILTGQRVVMFLDYQANQTAYPWLQDEFSAMWETPFDPLDTAFPCTVQRPPDLPQEEARNHRLYLMNHNLNAEVSLLGQSILVPAVSALNTTNAAEGNGSLGMAAQNCRADWGRPPNVLNVDYYNFGNFPGSVFEVAARMNNVTFVPRPCCGSTSAGGKVEVLGRIGYLVMVLGWGAWLLLG